MRSTGLLLDVKRFSVHDGPGVRTTLFLKGCPLRCRWCHNPESISPQPQLAYHELMCINCGECVEACPVQAHSLTDGRHHFDWIQCRACGACESVCLGRTLKLYGKRFTVEEAFAFAVEDRDFYGTNGGVTLSGGEPLVQPEFCRDVLTELRAAGIHTAIDTCGHVNWDCFENILPVTQMFLFDFKHADSVEHRRWTGQGNELIVANLKRLSEARARVEVRIPLIPGCNDSETNLQETGRILGKLRIEKVTVLPFNSMARSKYLSIGIESSMPDVVLQDDAALRRVVATLHDHGVNAVSGKE